MLMLIMTSLMVHVFNIIRKRHLEEVVDSFDVINDVIICIDIIRFPVIYSNINFNIFRKSFGYNLR